MNLIQRDLKHNWHPCTQIKDLQEFPPVVVTGAQGSYLQLADGRKIWDATSSWWCKSLGYNHPRLQQALIKQAKQFEQVIFANSTYEVIVELSEKLALLCPPLDKVFYASDGACAVEIAVKMALQAQQIKGQPQRRRLMALQNSYHGETWMALALTDIAIYKKPFEALLPKIQFIQGVPYVNSIEETLWQNCEAAWPIIQEQLNAYADNLAAIIVEPIVQGAGGMRVYSKDFLIRLARWAKQNDVYLIADEIMTGLGRTGYALACEWAQIVPDFVCLGKGLTAGYLPMSAVLTSEAIYHLFYDDYTKGKNFLHSHTHSGNALAAAVALETLKILEEENIYQQVRTQAGYLQKLMHELAQQTGKLTNVRGIGALVAADLLLDKTQANQRIGWQVFQKAMQLGAYLRPLGNTLYWLPPLNVTQQALLELRCVTQRAIEAVLCIN